MSDRKTRDRRPSDYGRRDFMRTGAWLGLGAGASFLPAVGKAGEGAEDTASQQDPKPVRSVGLGRTGVQVSDIGFGTFSLRDTKAYRETVRYALDRGVTQFDTAEGYGEGQSEIALGRALQGERQRATITTKLWAEADSRQDQLMARLNESLRRLRTDHVDFLLNHAVDSPDRMTNPEWSAFVEKAKAQGKIRFSGMSGHGPDLVPCLEAALEDNQLDVILVAYNYIQSPDFLDTARVWIQKKLGQVDWIALQPGLTDFLARAQQAGVGVMVMKTLRGAGHNDLRAFERSGGTFGQAALRWVLSDPRVDSAMITMRSKAQVDEYLEASGGSSPTGEDLAMLSRYEFVNRSRQCVQGCGACATSCPEGVPISEVLRAGMYERDYSEPEMARALYQSLNPDASPCLSCSGAPCANACPTGVPIQSESIAVHERLS